MYEKYMFKIYFTVIVIVEFVPKLEFISKVRGRMYNITQNSLNCTNMSQLKWLLVESGAAETDHRTCPGRHGQSGALPFHLHLRHLHSASSTRSVDHATLHHEGRPTICV
jgi:hypothetical protein